MRAHSEVAWVGRVAERLAAADDVKLVVQQLEGNVTTPLLTILKYQLFASSPFKRRFHYTLEMLAGSKLYENWTQLLALIENKGKDDGVVAKEKHLAFFEWFEDLRKNRTEVPSKKGRSRLRIYVLHSLDIVFGRESTS